LNVKRNSDKSDISFNFNFNFFSSSNEDILPSTDAKIPPEPEKFDEQYFSLVRDLSTRLQYPVRNITDLDEQIGFVTLAGKIARLRDVVPKLQGGCQKKDYPIIDATDLLIKAGRLLEIKGFREFFLTSNYDVKA
jgi:hypothetical protein